MSQFLHVSTQINVLKKFKTALYICWPVEDSSQGLQVGGAGERVAGGQLQLYHIEAGPPALRP